MDAWKVKEAMSEAVLLVDTREQETPRFVSRIKQIGLPYERVKLDFGDYSIKCKHIDLSASVVIERKMSADELATNFTRERKRFIREFERAKKNMCQNVYACGKYKPFRNI